MDIKFIFNNQILLKSFGFILFALGAASAEESKETTANTPSESTALDYLYNRSGREGSAAGTLSDDYRATKSVATSKQNATESLAAAGSTLDEAFEAFLSQKELNHEALAKYQKIFRDIRDFLTTGNIVDAYQSLIDLSEFECDGGISKQIANRVRAVWDTDSTARELLAENDALHSKVRLANWNADGHTASIQKNYESKAKHGSPGRPAAPAASEVKGEIGNLRITEEYFTSLDSKARIKLNEIKIGDIKTKAKLDLIDYIDVLYNSKKHIHVIIASDFYQGLFRDGELPPKVANHATASTVALRDTAKSIEVFKFKVQQKEIASASGILLNAWKIGDSTPEMMGLEREKKLTVIAHANRVRKLRNLIEVRDFDLLEPLLDELEELSMDFDTTKPRALVRAVKLDSKMRMGKARLYAQQGDTKRAMEEFKIAAEVWPGNPELETASSEYFAMEDIAARNVKEFDRITKEGNFRTLALEQIKFLHALQGDEIRLEKFKQALLRVRDAEAALEKAKMQDEAGDSAGAWETIEAALSRWSDDALLIQAGASYSSKVTEFVSSIKRAQDAEREGSLGASISLYALARTYYPSSLISAQGMNRLSDILLKDEAALSTNAANAGDNSPHQEEKERSTDSSASAVKTEATQL